MADEVGLDTLHAAIVADIKAAFPALATVEFYRETSDRVRLELPACLLELSEMELAEDEDPGTEQTAVEARFEARLIIGFRTPDAKVEIRKLAGAFAAFLRHRRWTDPNDPPKKLLTGPARFLAAMPDEFDPRLDQYEVWRVEWTQTLLLSEPVWPGEGVRPTAIYLGIAPNIGPDHVDDYILVAGEEPSDEGGDGG